MNIPEVLDKLLLWDESCRWDPQSQPFLTYTEGHHSDQDENDCKNDANTVMVSTNTL